MLQFRHALLGLGAFLMLLGIGVGIYGSGAAAQQGSSQDALDALFSGVSSSFFALFSGTIIGVGAALFTNGLAYNLRGTARHIAACLAFALIFVAIAAASVSDASHTTFLLLVVFFAGMAGAAAFLLSAVVFALSAYFARVMLHGKGGPPGPGRSTQQAQMARPSRTGDAHTAHEGGQRNNKG